MTNEKDQNVHDISDEMNSDSEKTQADGASEESGRSEIEEQRKQNLYLRADFENFRKQSIKERAELLKYGSEPLIREFLNIYDNLERATSIEVTSENLDSYKNGVSLIVTQFKKALERFGVEEVESLHQPFDPNMHEALTSEEVPELPSGSVTKVFKKGFKLHGKIIRPAQVVVNTAPEKKD
jgi:molecular chaperone GrpE